jgi:MFS family permease
MLSKYRNTMIASLGVALEYYDFLIYGLLGVYLTDVFFHEGQFRSLRYFSVFSLGYIFMPLGGLVFGLISDKYGRTKAFSFLLLMMALSTIVMGLLPTGGTIAVILIIAARIIQGIAFGGELPNAITLVYESSRRDAMHTGIISSSYAAGNILALLVMYLISVTLTHKQIVSFGWRIPFLFGGILSLISYMLRRQLLETSEYNLVKNQVTKKEWFAPLKALFKFSKLSLTLGLLLSVGTRAMIVFFIYLPTYLKQFFKYEPNILYLAMTGALVFSLIIGPTIGKISNICGKKKFIFGVATILIAIMPYFFI